MHKEFYNQLLINCRAEVTLTQRLEGDALSFLSAMEPNIEATLNKDLIRQHSLKCSQVLMVEFEKLALTADGNLAFETVTMTAYYRSKAAPITNAGNIRGVVQKAKAKILNEGSRWRVKRNVELNLRIASYKPFRCNS